MRRLTVMVARGKLRTGWIGEVVYHVANLSRTVSEAART